MGPQGTTRSLKFGPTTNPIRLLSHSVHVSIHHSASSEIQTPKRFAVVFDALPIPDSRFISDLIVLHFLFLDLDWVFSLCYLCLVVEKENPVMVKEKIETFSVGVD